MPFTPGERPSLLSCPDYVREEPFVSSILLTFSWKRADGVKGRRNSPETVT